MPLKPKSIARATPEEIEVLGSRPPGGYRWVFPEEVFNGEWWRIEVEPKQYTSALSSYRMQAAKVYKKRCQVYKKENGAVLFVRMTELDFKPGEMDGRRISRKDLERGASNGGK